MLHGLAIGYRVHNSLSPLGRGMHEFDTQLLDPEACTHL